MSTSARLIHGHGAYVSHAMSCTQHQALVCLLIPLLLPAGNGFSSVLSEAHRTRHIEVHLASSRQQLQQEDLFAAVHRKEHEMKQLHKQHASTTDPVRMALTYAVESVSPMRVAKALRRVYEDPRNEANPNYKQGEEYDGDQEDLTTGLRRASFIADIKRQSLLTYPTKRPLCQFDDASLVASAMVQLGADAVIINTDYPSYGGDWTELSAAVRAVRKVSKSAAVLAKDIIVDELQLGLAKNSGADGVILQSCVLGESLDSFLDLATFMGLECIVECHTKAEVERALSVNAAQTILVNNWDRVTGEYHVEQALNLAGLFPGSGGPIIALATGGLTTAQDLKRHLDAGYEGVVVGRAIMGQPIAPKLIRTVRERTFLPTELSQWGRGLDFDKDGNARKVDDNEW